VYLVSHSLVNIKCARLVSNFFGLIQSARYMHNARKLEGGIGGGARGVFGNGKSGGLGGGIGGGHGDGLGGGVGGG